MYDTMSDQPGVRVVVPAYRAEAALRRAVGSLLAETAARGYAAIQRLLQSRALRLSKAVHAAVHAEFSANRRVNRPFRHYVLIGRCASLEDLLDMTQNGRAPWVEAALAHLSEEPAGAA